jgi:hypothetical protein
MRKLKSVPATIKPNGTVLDLLPLTAEDLDAFVSSITKEYGLPEGDGTYEAIATAIVHMPANQAYAPRMHFGHIGLKQMATSVAFAKVNEFNEKRRAAQLELRAKAEQEKKAQDLAASLGQPIQDA